MKRTSQIIVGKDLVRIKHTFGNKASLHFGLIVPIASFNRMYKNRNDSLSANKKESID